MRPFPVHATAIIHDLTLNGFNVGKIERSYILRELQPLSCPTARAYRKMTAYPIRHSPHPPTGGLCIVKGFVVGTLLEYLRPLVHEP